MYRTLDPDKIVATLVKLESRIAERFPGSGLQRVCAELKGAAQESRQRLAALARPNRALRLGIAAVLGVGVALLAWVGSIVEVKRDTENLFGVLQGLEAAANIVVLAGAGVFFLVTLEQRLSRRRALAHLHELRSIVHVVDMHQLTKDPSTLLGPAAATPSSPQRTLTAFELTRYLDYCSEMLSLAAKVAALYAQDTRDPVVIETASDLGQTTSNLSAKIWQKISIVQATEGKTG